MSTEKYRTKEDKTDIKCRFFSHYFNQVVAKETKYPNSPNINTTTVFLINALSDYHLELKALSNYTDEDAIVVEKIWRNSDLRIEQYYKNINKKL